MSVWEYASIKASVHPVKVCRGGSYLLLLNCSKKVQAVDESTAIDQFPSFFEGARLNFAENILCRKDKGLAIINVNEDNISNPERHSWQDLRDLVAQYADALRSSGLRRGQVVARMIIRLLINAITNSS